MKQIFKLIVVWCTCNQVPGKESTASNMSLILQIFWQIADRAFHIGKRLLKRVSARLCLAIMRVEEVDSFGVANAANVLDNLEAQLQHMLNNAKADHQELLPVTEKKVKVHANLAWKYI